MGACHSDAAIAATFIAYMVVVLVIGIAAWRRTEDLGDYILGGRRLGPLVAALSAGASDMSGWLLLGLPGLAYLSGQKALWLAGGLLAGTWLNWRIVATALRQKSEAYGDSLTIPEYLERRFAQSRPAGGGLNAFAGPVLRAVSALFILFFFTIYTSSGLVAGGKLFSSVFGLPYLSAVLVGCSAIVAYTFLGGFLAVSWTDAFQALLMLAALLIVPAMALSQMVSGGDPGGSELISSIVSRAVSGEQLSVISALSLAAWGLGYFGQPHILARFMALSSPEKAASARRIATAWAALGMAAAICAGIAGSAFFSQGLSDSEKVFIMLVKALLHPVPAGICLAGILAAIMSTADSQLLVSSSALTEDFYRRLIRPFASQKELVWVGRATVILVAAGAALLASDPESGVLDMVGYAWAGFGAGFGPVIVMSLFWNRMTGAGAASGIVCGSLAVIAWRQLQGGIFDLYEIVPGIAAATAAVVLVSIAFPDRRGKEADPDPYEE